MDVLLMLGGAPYVEDTTIFVDFVISGRVSANEALRINFRIPYIFGQSTAQRRNQTVTAGQQAITEYFTALGRPVPSINRVETLGV